MWMIIRKACKLKSIIFTMPHPFLPRMLQVQIIFSNKMNEAQSKMKTPIFYCRQNYDWMLTKKKISRNSNAN